MASQTAVGAKIEAAAAPNDTKQRITQAAIRLFANKGYENSSVREIVEAAGVTKPVLYYYFKSKDDLLKSIANEAMEGILSDLAEACSCECEGIFQRLSNIKAAFIAYAVEAPDLLKVLHTIAFSGLYDHIVDFRSHWRKVIESVAKILEKEQRLGAIRDDLPPRMLAFQFVTISAEAMRAVAYCPDPKEMPTIDDSIISVFLEGAEKRKV